MKRLLLLILLVITTKAMSQIFTPVTNDTTLYGSATQNNFYGDINIASEVTVDQEMHWEVDSTNLPTNWQFSVCTQAICHPIGFTGSSWNLPSNGGYLNVHFYPNSVSGEGFIILKVYDVPGSNQVEYLTFRGNTLSTGLKDSNLENITVYPNPASDFIYLNGNSTSAKYEMVDILGKKVKSGILNTEEKTRIDIDDLLKGIYFVTVQKGKNQITRKIIVN